MTSPGWIREGGRVLRRPAVLWAGGQNFPTEVVVGCEWEAVVENGFTSHGRGARVCVGVWRGGMDLRNTCEMTDQDLETSCGVRGEERAKSGLSTCGRTTEWGLVSCGRGCRSEGAQPSVLSMGWAPPGLVIRPGAQEPGLGCRWEWEPFDRPMVNKAS